jgi:hypothetical protein
MGGLVPDRGGIRSEPHRSHRGNVAYRDVISNDLILNITVLGAAMCGLIIFFLGLWEVRAAPLLMR